MKKNGHKNRKKEWKNAAGKGARGEGKF